MTLPLAGRRQTCIMYESSRAMNAYSSALLPLRLTSLEEFESGQRPDPVFCGHGAVAFKPTVVFCKLHFLEYLRQLDVVLVHELAWPAGVL